MNPSLPDEPRSADLGSPRVPSRFLRFLRIAALLLLGVLPQTARPYDLILLTGVPDYEWHAGCFGTATGNLMGYWDRHGFPDFYTGPTAAGLAPLNSFGANQNIFSLWASQAGRDGRPANSPGHIDDYWVEYESTAPDPFVTRSRAEHAPDCLGDFIGLSQLKWPDFAGECGGNVDGYAFNFFDPGGQPRTNFTYLHPSTGRAIPDLQSGLRAWTASRGAEADSISQLADFNPNAPFGRGFTFENLVAEIDAGYPVLLYLQPFDEFSRVIDGVKYRNPSLHGMLAYGYLIDDDGQQYVRYRTSWASGDSQFSAWTRDPWTPNQQLNHPLRGVVCYHPKPRLLSVTRAAGRLRARWQGPLAIRRDDILRQETAVHRYTLERATTLAAPAWQPVASPVAALELDVPDTTPATTAFFRLRLDPVPR